MSDMMCHDHFISSQTHVMVVMFVLGIVLGCCVVSCDAIECDVTWKRIQLCLHRIHICLGLTFTCDSLSRGFT